MKLKSILSAAVILAALSQLSAATFVTSSGPLTAGGGSGEGLAIAFQLSANTDVAQLGVYVPAGFGGDTLTVSLWDGGAGANSSSAALASVPISSGTPDADGFVYATIPTQSLTAGIYYALSVSGYSSAQVGDTADPSFDSTPTYNGASAEVDLSWDGVGNPFHDAAYGAAGNNRFTIASFATPVPEPETYAMLTGLGLVGFGLYRRCRK